MLNSVVHYEIVSSFGEDLFNITFVATKRTS